MTSKKFEFNENTIIEKATSWEVRNDPLFLRNQFEKIGDFEMPKIKRQVIDLSNLNFIGYDHTKHDDENNKDKFVHFFLDDYKFQSIWKDPIPRIEKLRQYRGVLSPQFSNFYDMPMPMQIYNIFRSRWCGAYLQENGINVIPTVYWGLQKSFDFCFDGIERGSVVAVSTLGVKTEKGYFMLGYNEMMRRIRPTTIVCYCKPFEEMEGNIITIDYAETNNFSKKYEFKSYFGFDHNLKKAEENHIIKKSIGYVLGQEESLTSKGAGSAAGGGGWRPSPNKPQDGRFLGKPGEVKTYIKPNGEKFETKIGPNGKAIRERHWTNHNQPWAHTYPHDHIVDWSLGFPNPSKHGAINYPDGDVPSFKKYEGANNMRTIFTIPPDTNFDFESIDDFKDSLNRGGEIEFKWKSKGYSITRRKNAISISEWNKQDTEKLYSTVDELLDHKLDGEMLRSIVMKLKVWSRTI